ncbi:MAG TPA: YggT family protein [Gemmatimonadales bacterium]|nr:YggT family protein [Gemmatimonadales bacterium]
MAFYYINLITRGLVFGCFAFATLVALVHWLVQQAKIQPFGGFAVGVRRAADPVIKPLERRMLRSGRNPADAPYYLFWITLFGGLAIIALVQWLLGTIAGLLVASQYGSRGLLLLAVDGLFSILMLAIFIRVIASWFSISRYSWFMRLVHGLTDWLIDPLRKVIPPIGMIDIVPMVAYFMLYLARGFVLSVL